MGVGSILRFFLPQDDKFLPYFEQSADNLKEAGTVYASLAKANSREEIAAVRDKIKKLEHVGDKLTHSIFEELNRSFITPFDREDIYSLTKSMDDVLDLMDHVADILVLYRIDKVEDGMNMLLEVTRRAISDIHKSVNTSSAFMRWRMKETGSIATS
jgi:predicted phosphate transport protein (TIGR00153 family)